MLTKALNAPPEKWHGLQDVEIRYRQRYADLIANAEVRARLRDPLDASITAIRRFLDGRGYIEVETPTLQPLYGGAAARPFTTHHNALDQTFYLRIADELYLKRLIVGGFERVYEICKDFRNEGMDRNHSPEFTMLEFYEAYADYRTMMDPVEAADSSHVADDVFGGPPFTTRGTRSTSRRPWPRMTLREAISEASGIDYVAVSGPAETCSRPRARPAPISRRGTVWPRIVDELLKQFVRPEPDPADLPDRLPGRALAAGEAQAGRSDPRRAVPALHRRRRDRQRVHRAERPAGPTRALPRAAARPRRRRRRSDADRRGLSSTR